VKGERYQQDYGMECMMAEVREVFERGSFNSKVSTTPEETTTLYRS
jgi:hypothetical protein